MFWCCAAGATLEHLAGGLGQADDADWLKHGRPSFEGLPLKNHLGLLHLADMGIRGLGLGVGIGWEQGHAGVEPVVGEERGQGGSRVLSCCS